MPWHLVLGIATKLGGYPPSVEDNEDGHFRFAAEGGKGTDTGHVLFVGYFDNNKPPMELPLPQEPEQYKHLKWPPDPWWK